MPFINLGIRFLLELCALAIYGYWGYSVGNAKVLKWTFAFEIPVVAAIAWGMFGSPKAPVQLSKLNHYLFEAAFLGIPVVLLFTVGKPVIAVTYGIIAVINKILMIVDR